MKRLDRWRIRRQIKRARWPKNTQRPDYDRDAAWERALQLARASDGWLTVNCYGKRNAGEHPVEITRVSKMGTVYGRKYTRTGKIGAERAWGSR